MTPPRLPDEALRTIPRIGVFVLFAIAGLYVFGWGLFPFGYLVASALSVFAAAAVANALAMRIYEHASLVETGLNWSPASARNLLVGLGSGIVAAVLILAVPLVAGLEVSISPTYSGFTRSLQQAGGFWFFFASSSRL